MPTTAIRTPWRALALALLLPAAVQDRPQAEGAGAPPFGAWLRTLPDLREPAALAFAEDGSMAVAEATGDRVRILDPQGRELRRLGGTGSGPGELLDPRGVAFAPDGSVLVADTGNHRVQVFDAQGRFVRAFGRWGAAPGELNEPRGLALAGDALVVADARNHRLQVFGLDGAHRAVIGGRGDAPGRFQRPLDVALDPRGNLYVADADNHRVQKLSPRGEPLAAWGDFGPHPGFFTTPAGLDWHAGLVYVADRDNHRVQVFDEGGALQYEWGVHALRPREADGKLHYPDQVAVSPSGAFVALAESFEDRVQLFQRVAPGAPPNGTALRFERDTSAHYGPNLSLGGGLLAVCEPTTPSLTLFDLSLDEPINVCQLRGHGRGVGALLRPEDAALDAARGLVHVADPGNRRIATYGVQREPGPLRYDPGMLRLRRSVDLELLHREHGGDTPWPLEPAALATAPDGSLCVVDPTRRAVVALSEDFCELRAFDGGAEPLLRPATVAFGADGARLYVVDELAARVRVFAWDDPAVEHAPIGARGPGPGQFVRPYGVAVDSTGTLHVSDAARHDVQRFAPDGRLLGTAGGEGLGQAEFFKPKDLAVGPRPDGAGEALYVLDFGNHRGQVLDLAGAYLSTFGARLYTRPARRPQ